MKAQSLLMLISLSAATIVSGCKKKEEAPREVGPRPVKIMEIRTGGKFGNAEYSGRIRSANQADLSFEISGRLVKLPVKEGDRVTRGQVLAELDKRDVQAALASARAQLNAAKADYERNRELYKSNSISRRQLDTSRKSYEMSQADVASASKRVSDATIKAPFAGTIAKRFVENFESIQAKQQIITIVDQGQLEVVVDIPERDMANASAGKSVASVVNSLDPHVVISAIPGKKFPAQFKEVSSVADDITRTFALTLSFEQPKDSKILPGMTAKLELSRSQRTEAVKTKVILPSNAVFNKGTKEESYVWKIKNGSATIAQVEVNALTGQEFVIDSGIEDGDSIAISGVHNLFEGQKVRPMQTKEN